MGFFRAHSLVLLLACAAVFTFVWLLSQRHRLRMSVPWAGALALLHVLLGVACVKVFAVLEAGSFSAAGSMSLFGAVFFLPLAYWLGAKLSRRETRAVFDVFAVPMVFTLAVARVNCLITGCCQGRLIPGTDLRYPTREAELVFYVLILGWFLRRTRRGDPKGILYPVYMLCYGLFRFVTEFFRLSESNSVLHLSHLWAALCLLTGLSVLLELRRPRNPAKAKPRKHKAKHS